MSWDVESFRQKVEDQHTFPGYYSFKFIVPAQKKEQILEILPEAEVSFRLSSNQNYLSITAKARLNSSQEVVDVYFAANKIEGCIAL